MDVFVYYLLHYTYLLIIPLFLIKVVSFLFYKSKRWKFSHFFYFGFYNVFDTDNERIKARKKFQNGLSLAILVLIFLQVLLFLFGSKVLQLSF